MKLLLDYDGKRHIFDATWAQYQDLRRAMALRFAELKEQDLPTPDYTIANLDAPQSLLLANGVKVEPDASPSTTADQVIALF